MDTQIGFRGPMIAGSSDAGTALAANGKRADDCIILRRYDGASWPIGGDGQAICCDILYLTTNGDPVLIAVSEAGADDWALIADDDGPETWIGHADCAWLRDALVGYFERGLLEACGPVCPICGAKHWQWECE